VSSAASTGDVARAYFDAVAAGDRRRAFSVVDGARTAGMGHRELYLDVFQPALREVGRLWQEDRMTVAEEHLATAITQASMARLYDDLFARAPEGEGPLLIAACADVERHEVGLRMICDLLELEGWDTVFLGAATPVEDLARMVEERGPAVVALSASIAPHLARMREAVRVLRDRLGERTPLILAGGRPFVEDPGLAARIGADLTAPDAVEAVNLLQERFAA
jgi:methanogenic corrinoid protein MtbC1